jgi:transposase-like protein
LQSNRRHLVVIMPRKRAIRTAVVAVLAAANARAARQLKANTQRMMTIQQKSAQESQRSENMRRFRLLRKCDGGHL